jgi:hypothetical protein
MLKWEHGRGNIQEIDSQLMNAKFSRPTADTADAHVPPGSVVRFVKMTF